MKINQIILYHLQMPLVRPFETSFGRIYSRECVLVEAVTDGLVGYGECAADRDPGYSYETVGTAWHILEDFLVPAVLHQEITRPEDVQTMVVNVRGHHMAKAGLEMAVWDLMGKLHGQSMREMLGGIHKKVDVGVSVGLQETPCKLVDVVGEYLSQGYGRVKIKIKPGRDVGDTKAVRERFPELRLQVDANSAYTLDGAVSLAALDELSLLLIEQPLAEDDMWDHSKLQKMLRTPICLDESITSLRHARQALEMQACRVINIKAGRVGGLSQGKMIRPVLRPGYPGGAEDARNRRSGVRIGYHPARFHTAEIPATDRYYTRT
jgi:O-succinylbenzoate synthase